MSCCTQRMKLFFVMHLAIAALILSTGCGEDKDIVRIDFSNKDKLESPRDMTGKQTLTVAVAAMVSPDETFKYYWQLLKYLGDELDINVQLIQRKTYADVNVLLEKGEIELAFICSGPYATSRKHYGFEGLAVPQIRQKKVYRSYLIVNKDSRIEKLEDMRGMVFAFTDPDSNTGRIVPGYLLMQKGETADSFFARTIFTYSHDNSIMAVARSLVAGAFVHEQIWEHFHQSNPRYTSRTRVIFKSEPFGNPPLVASAKLPGFQKAKIRNLVLRMHDDPKGRAILEELLIDRFLPVDESLYEPIRVMHAQLQLGEQGNVSAQQP